MQDTPSDSRTRRWTRIALLLAFYGCLILAGRWLGMAIEAHLQVSSITQAGMPYLGVVAAILVAYIVLTAIPFVPGTEIGVALLMVFGAPIAAIVYLSTIAALTLSFTLGRLVPEHRLAAWLARHGFVRASRLVAAFERLGPEGRDRYLTQTAPRWLKPWLVDHRIITLVMLINLPGNTLLGGGGGIALMTGLSKLMSVPQFMLCISLAVAPVPIAVLLASWWAG
ncbi:MAG: hypothetical protein ABJN75_17525 [Hoeflea sp.]|uniref:hypothetical protein n=1 Tax=Hoeflea sp. TaxID=1940281 RepID=UPI0032980AD3|tara:strand:- start:7417 stop:8091 length:675 start_codon:yes stop_codon:yes gene_type:complete